MILARGFKVATFIVVSSILLAACSHSPAVNHSRHLSSPVGNSANGQSSSTTVSNVPSLLLEMCSPSGGWEELNPTSGQIMGRIPISSDLSEYGSCYNSSFGSFDTVGALGATSILQTLSTNLMSWARVETVGTGSDTHACYTLYDSANCIDASGVSSSDFSQQSAQDSNVLFNPKTGDLWWERNGDLLSNALAGAKILNHGLGTLLSFTPQGAPMPFTYYDSPSGNIRLIEITGGYSGSLAYGPTSRLTSACLQARQQEFSNGNYTICGASSANTLASACNSNMNNGNTAGLISDTAVVCYGDSRLEIIPLKFGGSSQNPNGKSLIPATTQTITSAIVSPNGVTVFFLAASDTSGLTLYSVASSGSGTIAPTKVASLPFANTSGSSFGPFLIGWSRNGQLIN